MTQLQKQLLNLAAKTNINANEISTACEIAVSVAEQDFDFVVANLATLSALVLKGLNSTDDGVCVNAAEFFSTIAETNASILHSFLPVYVPYF